LTDPFCISPLETVSQSPKVALSSRTHVRDLRFLAALEMTTGVAEGFLQLRHNLLRRGKKEVLGDLVGITARWREQGAHQPRVPRETTPGARSCASRLLPGDDWSHHHQRRRLVWP